ncbi:MAG: HAD family acid phosphatase [Legionellaceae bacterium]|nr:HAD family acid phosphatase [Legionellaceae bacterium]
MNMLRIPSIVALSALAIGISFAEPPNLSLLKQKVIAYHDSGAYEKELAAVSKQAENFIQQKVSQNTVSSQKLAIVLDIDETSLSNYQHMIENDFTGNRELIHQNIMRGDDAPIVPILNLYKAAEKQNVAVFFVTGRRPSEQKSTEENLKKVGFTQWAGIFFKPEDYHQSSAIPFKEGARETIAKEGYTIIASLGDQKSDITGKYMERGFKLPNPYYYIP